MKENTRLIWKTLASTVKNLVNNIKALRGFVHIASTNVVIFFTFFADRASQYNLSI